ncbi:MAG: hypothetical protein CW338_11595, partial [Clostridiales bacterium]|nr:hypothetical protein [Clostridiales bacterium]
MRKKAIRYSLLLVFALLLLLAACAAQAEVSGNLFSKKTYGSNGKVATFTYIDEYGQPAFAQDKGYATNKSTHEGYRR